MEKKTVLDAFSALAYDMWLDVDQLLIKAGVWEHRRAISPSRSLDVRSNTLSNNLTILSTAGLITSQRKGPSIRYFALMEAMRGLLGFLMQDCCSGQKDPCKPVLDQTSCAR